MSFSSEIAAAEYWIRQTLKGSTALAAKTTTVEAGPLPRGAALPAVVYTLLNASYITNLQGVRLFTGLHYQISAFGQAQTILALAEIDSIAQGLFGNGRESRVCVATPYGTVLTCAGERPHNLEYTDPADNRTMRKIGATYYITAKGL